MVAGNYHPYFLFYIVHAQRLDLDFKLERLLYRIGLFFHIVFSRSNKSLFFASSFAGKTASGFVFADDGFAAFCVFCNSL
ncbi:hypothetical protein D3C80_1959870 [compost metagenome]